MSRRGLELLKNLFEVKDAVTALDNLCVGAAGSFGSDDFRIFTSNKKNISIFSYIPNNFSLQLSSYGGVAGSYRVEIPKSRDVDLELVNLNIAEGDILAGEGFSPNTRIERIDIFQNEVNAIGLPVTELVLTNQLTATIGEGSSFTLIKQNSATITNNLFILGKDCTAQFYNGDKITAIYYPLSTSTNPILNTNTVDLYVVDNSYIGDQFSFGLSLTERGSRINISSVNSLCAINLYRSNEVTSRDFRNIFLPEAVDYPDSDPTTSDGIPFDYNRRYYSLIERETVKDAFTELEQKVDFTASVLSEKIHRAKDNITNKNINIEGVLRVADPGQLNTGSINTTNSRAPSIYILDPTTGSLNNKTRIFSTFDSPWVTTTNSLSTNKNINVGSLTFEKNIYLEKATIQAITPTTVEFTRKIPISIVDSTGFTSTYFLLASSVN